MQFGLGFAKLFFGERIRKTETNLFWRKFGLGFRAEEGFGEESARAFGFLFLRPKILILSFY